MKTNALCAPARLYLQIDARDLARIAFGIEFGEIATRLHHTKRMWIATVLIDRGWPVLDVARTLGYCDATTLRYHLKRQVAA